MPDDLTELLHPWHDFYALLGTASATLVGLMFVAASVGANYYTDKHEQGMRTFISPTVVHFSAVLLVCLVAELPVLTWTTLAVLLSGGGVVGIAYAGWVWRGVGQRRQRGEIELIDRVWYALIPVVGYLLIAAAGVAIFLHAKSGPLVMAAALFVLLLAGLRNAWDMTLWIVIRAGKT